MTSIILAALTGLGVLAIDCAAIRRRRPVRVLEAVHVWTWRRLR